MKIDLQRMGSITVLSPRAAIAQGEVEEFARIVEDYRQKTNGRFVLEFSQVPFMDSKGLETLLDLVDRQQQTGQAIKVAAVPELCREIFELTGVAPRLDLFDTAESAVRSFL
jgi:anti-sigma B factor antagonist